jgi:uncharacterized phage infection (PIP) family protein YhgE
MIRKVMLHATGCSGFRLFVLLLAGCLLAPSSVARAASGSELLEKKMNQIIGLQKKLSEKVTRAENVLGQLNEQLDGLAVEIQDERLRAGVLSYRDAIRLQSLDNRLKLAQQLLSYIGQVNKKIATFRDGGRQLTFLYQEATDDLKIIQTLSHLRLDDFTARTDRLLDYLSSELAQHLFSAGAIRYAHTAGTWEAVITRN